MAKFVQVAVAWCPGFEGVNGPERDVVAVDEAGRVWQLVKEDYGDTPLMPEGSFVVLPRPWRWKWDPLPPHPEATAQPPSPQGMGEEGERG